MENIFPKRIAGWGLVGCLATIILIGLIVRFYYFPDNVYFGYDQARDAFNAREIFSGDIKIIGPTTSREGIYHGPLYWYLIAPMYWLFADPSVVAGLLRILNLFTIILVFLIARELFDSKIGILASFFYAISFENWQSALYFGNPGPAAISSLVFYFGLVKIIQRKKTFLGWFLCGLGLGISIQLQFYLVYNLGIFILGFILFRKSFFNSFTTGRFLIFLSAFFATTFTFFLSEIKFNLFQTKAVLNLLLSGGGHTLFEDKLGLFERLVVWIEKLQVLFIDSLGLPSPEFHAPGITYFSFIGAVLLISSVFWTYKVSSRQTRYSLSFLVFWIFSSCILFLLKAHNFYYIVGISGGIVILLSVFLSKLSKRYFAASLAIVIAILIGNATRIIKQAPNGSHPEIYTQRGMLLKDEKKIVDYIYNQSTKGSSVVYALTMPYDIYTTWAYLFSWYGLEKYGYLPFWNKPETLGFPGKLEVAIRPICDRFVIYEPSYGFEHLESIFREDQEITSVFVDKSTSGSLSVEKRKDRVCL